MNRLLVASFLFVGLFPSVSPALDITNITPRYGPFGAVRKNLKCVRNDTLIITYDLTGLTVEPKSGKVKFSTKLELINSKGASIFDKTDNYDPVLQLGGGKMPSLAHITPGAAQAPGKYTARITITDLLDKNEKNGKTFNYPFEILGDQLGFIQVAGPAFGVPGLNYVAEFGLANLTLDKKNLPKAEVNIRVLDEKGVAVDTAKYSLPADLPDNLDLAKANVIPFRHGVYPNRPGRFTLEISAEDKLANANSKIQLSYPFVIVDINTITAK